MIDISLTPRQVALARTNARKAEIGGRSHVHSSRANRLTNLSSDQYVGQAGELALSLYLTGSEDSYIIHRAARNRNPYQGDNGFDLPGHPIDIKTSRMRRGEDYLYHLYVRDREYHRDRIYVLALMPEDNDSVVRLCGWATSDDLIHDYIDDRYLLRMDQLRAMPEIKYSNKDLTS